MRKTRVCGVCYLFATHSSQLSQCANARLGGSKDSNEPGWPLIGRHDAADRLPLVESSPVHAGLTRRRLWARRLRAGSVRSAPSDPHWGGAGHEASIVTPYRL